MRQVQISRVSRIVAGCILVIHSNICLIAPAAQVATSLKGGTDPEATCAGKMAVKYEDQKGDAIILIQVNKSTNK